MKRAVDFSLYDCYLQLILGTVLQPMIMKSMIPAVCIGRANGLEHFTICSKANRYFSFLPNPSLKGCQFNFYCKEQLVNHQQMYDDLIIFGSMTGLSKLPCFQDGGGQKKDIFRWPCLQKHQMLSVQHRNLQVSFHLA